MPDLALLTDRRFTATVAEPGDWYLGNILREDGLLQAALADCGITSARVDWADPTVNWSRFKLAVFRTTWDYFDRFPEFSSWLDRVRHQTTLCNPASIIRWNLDKHYLADLEARGMPIVPSYFIERGSDAPLADLLRAKGWSEAVLKPCVSGVARHTYRVNLANAGELEPTFRQLVRDEALILQPFQPAIQQTGEDTLVLFDGKFSHAVRKMAKAGDFRVQDDHGGTVHDYSPSAQQIELAERVVACCQPLPAYGRVDLVRDQAGRWVIMELELIEPELWLRRYPPAAEAFARVLARTLADR